MSDVERELTFDEKMRQGCDDLYLSKEEILSVIKVLSCILTDQGKPEFFGYFSETLGDYKITAETDAWEGCEDGVFLIKEKI